MIYKILGLFLVIIGAAIIKYFPDVETYQSEGMTLSGLLVGGVLILVGVALLIFG
jgi:hypothetical protein